MTNIQYTMYMHKKGKTLNDNAASMTIAIISNIIINITHIIYTVYNHIGVCTTCRQIIGLSENMAPPIPMGKNIFSRKMAINFRQTHNICQTSQELSQDKEKAREGDSQRCWCFYHGDRGQVSWQWEHVETKYGLFPEAYSWNNTWTTHEQHMNNTTTVSKTLQWLVENNLVMKFSTSRIPNTFGPSESESLIFSKSWGGKNMQNVSPSLSCRLFEQFCPPRNIPCRAAMLGSQRACSPVLSSAGQCPSFGTIGIPQCKIAETGRNITPRANGCL